MTELKLQKRKDKAISEGNKGLQVSACIGLAEMYVREGRYTDSIKEYKEVSDFYQEQNRPMDYARANRMIGEAYTNMREFNKALKHQEVHLAVAKEQGDKLEEQRALATIGHTYLTSYLEIIDNPNKKSLNLASKAFMRSLAICESLTGISKREHMDMMSRLFANLGVVQECQGNYDKGIELVQRSINICKSNDIYEQLQRNYSVLASLYSRKEDFSEAIHFYNLAMEVASRLDDKVPLMCSALSSKADILIKLADLQRAKNVLLRAYKMKSPNAIEQRNIEHNLKVVTSMCYTEDSLLLASDSDHHLNKSLYEKMGDGACVLKNYTKAIEYYHKMLECALKNEDDDKDLSACYVSLAQTYNDNRQYDQAIEYFKKDYEICKGNMKEGLSSLFSIVESLEAAGNSMSDIIEVFNKARRDCRLTGNNYLEGKTLMRYIATLKKHNASSELIQSLEKELHELDYTPSESESESDEPTTQDIGHDIHLENITDNSEVSGDETDMNKPRKARKRNKGFLVKRNDKGETPLHKACIAGQAALVEKLLDQGHVVNVRDNCGWLPIHEACNMGHLPIVKMLVEKGASINDQGGTGCLGVTPLHDAAQNGRLDVIDYLLDIGTSAVGKTDAGNTVLDDLNEWRRKYYLSPVLEPQYNSIVQRLSAALEKTGQFNKEIEMSVTPYKENKTLVQDSMVSDKRLSERRPKNKSPIVDLRRTVDNFDDDGDVNFDTKATCEYKNIMDNLRHRNTAGDDRNKRKLVENLNRSALLEPNEVDDDWLEDDVGTKDGKRRKTNGNDYVNSNGIKSAKSPQKLDEFSNEICDVHEITNDPVKVNKRKSQSTLMKAGFTRKRSESPTAMQKVSQSPSSSQFKQVKLTSFGNVQPIIEPDSTTDLSNFSVNSGTTSNSIMNKTLSIDVRIDGKLFRIPIPVTQLDALTMKWLADEATRRFYKKESMRPIIELETKNGALLSEDDFVSILFPVGGLQSEEVHARVVKWNIPPIAERYRDACCTLNYDVCDRVLEHLETTTVTFSVPDETLRDHLHPVCRALNRQSNLYELNLGGNNIGDRCIELLCESLPSLDNLSILILNTNNLTYKSLNSISTTVSQSSKPLLGNLYKLDLSYNPLENESYKFLAALTRTLRLKSLSLCSVNFNSDIFQLFYNRNLDLQLEFIEDLDISHNELSKDNLTKFLSWLQPLNLKTLNIGNNMVQEAGLGGDIVSLLKKNDFGFPNLKILNFSKCRINDGDMFDLISILRTTENLEELDLSCNSITSSSVKCLLGTVPLLKLNVSCCTIDPATDLTGWELVNGERKCRTLFSTLDYVEDYRVCDTLVNLWRTEYKELTDVKGLDDGMLQLSVSEFVE